MDQRDRAAGTIEPVGARTKPSAGQTKIVNVAELPWRILANGARMKVLYQDEETGAMTALFNFAPGMGTPLHQHTGVEQTFVLEGGWIDHDGVARAGTFVVRDAGSVHKTHAPNGSLHLAVFSKPNRMLEGGYDDAFPKANMEVADPNAPAPQPTAGQSKFINVNDMPWHETSTPGIKCKALYRDPATGASTMLLKFAPGAKTPRHEHTGLEQTYVIEGGLVDHDGAITAGNFVWRKAGSVHQATAPNGSLHLAFFARPNRMLDGAEDDLAAAPIGAGDVA